ncbi:MAG TPA: ADP-ribosyl-[dinitrogen reductase] hydrolase [Polyangiaceae bacterium]
MNNKFALSRGDIRNRAIAALLGVAVGDALGATLEFLTPAEIRTQYGVLREIRGGGWLRLRKGEVTDDTEMSLCVARSLAEVGWSPRDIAQRFADWLKSRPRDVGGTCRRGIRRFINDGTLAGLPCDADAGNGAAMRMAPIALATIGDETLLTAWAREQAHLTHVHPLSDAACLLVGRLLQFACLGRSKIQLRRVVDSTLEQWPIFQFSSNDRTCSAYVVDTMRTVLHHLFSTRNFEDCLVSTVNDGGDSDTAGAIVGAIAGAYYGLDAIPQRWIDALEPKLVSEIRLLAVTLVEQSPLFQTAQAPT